MPALAASLCYATTQLNRNIVNSEQIEKYLWLLFLYQRQKELQQSFPRRILSVQHQIQFNQSKSVIKIVDCREEISFCVTYVPEHIILVVIGNSNHTHTTTGAAEIKPDLQQSLQNLNMQILQ